MAVDVLFVSTPTKEFCNCSSILFLVEIVREAMPTRKGSIKDKGELSFPEFKPEVGWIKARLDKRSVCKCGYRAVSDKAPTGKMYDLDIRSVRHALMECNGCGDVVAIHMVRVCDGRMVGYMVFELFTLNPEEKII
jgi:hypothetical protein